MYTKLLKAISRQVQNENALYHTDRCPDKTWTHIRYANGQFLECELAENEKPQGKIIFILESPHKEEYCDPDDISPAKGKTGDNFNDSLTNFLVLSQYHKECFASGVYEVVVMNAVQYQISLGLEPIEYRTVIFQLSWLAFARDDFIERLREHLIGFEKQHVIFNACTKGNTLKIKQARNLLGALKLTECVCAKIVLKKEEINLSDLISSAVDEAGFNSYRASHPINWDKMIS